VNNWFENAIKYSAFKIFIQIVGGGMI